MNVWYQFLASLIRYLLAAVLGALVVRQIIPDDLAATIAGMLDSLAGSVAVGLLGVCLPLLWSWWNKIKAKVAQKTALELPPGATPARLEDAMNQKTVTEKVKEAVE